MGSDSPIIKKSRVVTARTKEMNRLWKQRNRDRVNARRRERWRTDPEHKQKRLAEHRQYRIDNPGWHRSWMLKHHYKITTEQYEEMFAKQNGLCFLCGRPPKGKHLTKPLLCVDH